MVRSTENEDGRWPDEADDRDFSNAASAAPAGILAGMLVYGGAGWLLSRWLHVPALLPIGLVLGLVFGSYLVYVRYGR
jgi:ATP synthase protein I